jgi:hypothetical protein
MTIHPTAEKTDIRAIQTEILFRSATRGVWHGRSFNPGDVELHHSGQPDKGLNPCRRAGGLQPFDQAHSVPTQLMTDVSQFQYTFLHGFNP